MEWNKIQHDPHHLGVPSGVSKMTSKPMVHFAQTVHRSCTDTNPVSKRNEKRFDMTHVILKFHKVHPEQFLGLWYVRCKQYTHLALRLALSSNGQKWASTWASSPRSTIECIQNDFYAHGTFGTNRALSCNDSSTISKLIETRFDMTHVT
jgi:hypothetical protein